MVGNTLTADGSIVAADGTVLYYSCTRFKEEIVQSDTCFICGTSRDASEFNDEHVMPRWLLRSLGLFDATVTLPGGSEIRYGQWKLPCCTNCNALLGTAVEQPVSELLRSGYCAVVDHIRQTGPWMLFEWLNLIFLKTYLKSMSLRFHVDRRPPHVTIGETVDWDTMHHLHCVARSRYTHATVDARVMGSMFILPAKGKASGEQFEEFDYADLVEAKALMVRFKDIAIFCILDDACATFSVMKDTKLFGITGPLSPLQCREFLARIGYTNSLLKERPEFFTQMRARMPHISVRHPGCIELDEEDPARFGKMMHHLCTPIMDSLPTPPTFSSEALREGRWTFMFDSNGHFDRDSMEFVPDTSQ